ncbi:MAG: bacteriohemerythrin [Desulfovibrio sp.]|jgi:hemerythrin-like metal-binding protein|nr:bacteriohemerythrin [Desulfovibrio sp.]
MHKSLFIVWHKKNEVGIKLIDEQHKGIVSIINTFYYMIQKEINKSLLYSCISDTMKTYSKIHFITEESFLELAGYQDLESHRKIHDKLSLSIDTIERKCIVQNDITPLLEFLKKWWIEHINIEDKQYAQALYTYVQSQKR